MVEVEESETGLIVHDLYVDFLVPPDAERYHVLDLDELGDALSRGLITPARCAAALTAAQTFVDRHLRWSTAPPPPFPPRGVAELAELPSFLGRETRD